MSRRSWWPSPLREEGHRSVARSAGKGSDGKDVYLREIWPGLQEIQRAHECRDESGYLIEDYIATSKRRTRCERNPHQQREVFTSGIPSQPTFRASLL